MEPFFFMCCVLVIRSIPLLCKDTTKISEHKKNNCPKTIVRPKSRILWLLLTDIGTRSAEFIIFVQYIFRIMAKDITNESAVAPVGNKRETLSARLKKNHPDEEWPDDEALFGRINDDYDAYEHSISDYENRVGEYEKELGHLRDNENKMTKMLTSDPRSAAFLMSWRENGNPVSELIRVYGKDFLEYASDHPEEMATAEKDYLDRVSKERGYEEEYNQNLDASVELLEKLQQERGLSDDEMSAAVDKLVAIAHNVIMGKFDADAIDLVLKATGYDAAVASASHEGEVRGRNQREGERLLLKKKGDGIPQLAGGGGGAPPTERKSMGALDRADNKTIWERGQEKRVKY